MTAPTTPRQRLPAFLPVIVSKPIALGVAVIVGVFRAWEEVREQGYTELGFTRSTFLTVREQLLAPMPRALAVGICAAALLFVVALVALWRGYGFDARSRLALLRNRSAIAWTSVVAALFALAGLLLIEREREWIGATHIYFAFAAVLGTSAVLACLGRFARASEGDVRRDATAAATLPALAVLVIGGFWVNRELAQHPRDPETWVFDALLVLAATFVFLRSRSRARAELEGRPTSLLGSLLSLAALLGLALTGLAYGSKLLEGSLGAPALVAKQPLNVVFIGIDTLRVDATSLLGPSLRGRDTTPNLRKLAARGLLFDNAVSQAPWTMPSFASMLTGKYPHEHGAYSLSGGVRAKETMLAEVLREAGYRTLGVVSHTYLGATHGFPQGFERYDESQALGHRAITSKQVTDLALRALDGVHGEPFFLFAHYFDAHYEYMDHERQTWADGYKGWLRNELDFENLLKNRQLLTQAENDWLLDLYEEEIEFLDAEIGRLIDQLDARGLSANTLIVVAGDHGEEFLDHGSFGHTTTLYQEQLHVPLIVVAPSVKAAERVKDVVETRAIFGTVLDALELDFAKNARERSLLRHANAGTESSGGRAFSIVWLPDALLEWGKHMRISSLREGRWKLIRDATREKTMLFDVESDPHELRDLAGEQAEIVGRMQPVLETWTQEQQNRGGAATTVKIDREQLRMLQQLGYL